MPAIQEEQYPAIIVSIVIFLLTVNTALGVAVLVDFFRSKP